MKINIGTLDGRLLMPGDDDYEQARQSWLQNYDSKPAMIAEVHSIKDIQKVLEYANAEGLPVAIRSTGHGAIKPIDGAILIKTQAMKSIDSNPDAQTITFEPGVTTRDLTNVASEYNLSPITGDQPSVGAVGFTLGGGHGWLSRQYGLGADNIIEATLVTLQGKIVTVNATTNPDLFWAIKGGSGNFGVVASLTVRLHPVQNGLGGTIFFDAEHAEILLKKYAAWARHLPAAYTVFLQAFTLPGLEQLPATIRGRRVVALNLFFNDDVARAHEVLQRFLESLSCKPLENFVSEKTYAEFYLSAPTLAPAKVLDAAGLQSDITAEQIPLLAKQLQGNASFSPVIQIRPWGGVLEDVGSDSLLQYADIGYSVYAVATLNGDNAEQAHVKQAFSHLAQHIKQHASKQFINFTADKEAVKQAYAGASLQELQKIKKRYDPSNLFSLGHTIE